MGARGRCWRKRRVIYEVFRQERKGQAFPHAGSIAAPDAVFAEAYAREQYGRRGESTRCGSSRATPCRRSTSSSTSCDRNYHRVDGYPLKAKLKEARERAGTAPPRDR